MGKVKVIPLVIIGVLIVLLFLQRECSNPVVNQVNDTIVISDTITRDRIVNKVKTVVKYKPITVVDCIFVYADTAEILSDYNKLKIYKRNLWKDDVADITSFDTVYQNSLLGSHLEAKFHVRDTTIIRTQIVKEAIKPRNKVFVGLQLGYIKPDGFISAPTLHFLTKKDNMYSLGYDPFNKAYLIGMSWKIH